MIDLADGAIFRLALDLDNGKDARITPFARSACSANQLSYRRVGLSGDAFLHFLPQPLINHGGNAFGI